MAYERTTGRQGGYRTKDITDFTVNDSIDVATFERIISEAVTTITTRGWSDTLVQLAKCIIELIKLTLELMIFGQKRSEYEDEQFRKMAQERGLTDGERVKPTDGIFTFSNALQFAISAPDIILKYFPAAKTVLTNIRLYFIQMMAIIKKLWEESMAKISTLIKDSNQSIFVQAFRQFIAEPVKISYGYYDTKIPESEDFLMVCGCPIPFIRTGSEIFERNNVEHEDDYNLIMRLIPYAQNTWPHVLGNELENVQKYFNGSEDEGVLNMASITVSHKDEPPKKVLYRVVSDQSVSQKKGWGVAKVFALSVFETGFSYIFAGFFMVLEGLFRAIPVVGQILSTLTGKIKEMFETLVISTIRFVNDTYISGPASTILEYPAEYAWQLRCDFSKTATVSIDFASASLDLLLQNAVALQTKYGKVKLREWGRLRYFLYFMMRTLQDNRPYLFNLRYIHGHMLMGDENGLEKDGIIPVNYVALDPKSRTDAAFRNFQNTAMDFSVTLDAIESGSWLGQVRSQFELDQRHKDRAFRVLSYNTHGRPFPIIADACDEDISGSDFEDAQTLRASWIPVCLQTNFEPWELPNVICFQELTNVAANRLLHMGMKELGYNSVSTCEEKKCDRSSCNATCARTHPIMGTSILDAITVMNGMSFYVKAGTVILESASETFMHSADRNTIQILQHYLGSFTNPDLIRVTGADWMGNKGMLWIVVEYKGATYGICGTHPSPYVILKGLSGTLLVSDDARKIANIHRIQILLCRKFIKKQLKNCHRKLDAVFICGDFNINKYDTKPDADEDLNPFTGATCCSREFMQTLNWLEADAPRNVPDTNPLRWIYEKFPAYMSLKSGTDMKTYLDDVTTAIKNASKVETETNDTAKESIKKEYLLKLRELKEKLRAAISKGESNLALVDQYNALRDVDPLNLIPEESGNDGIQATKMKVPAGFGGLYTWSGYSNSMTFNPLWPGSVQLIDFVLLSRLVPPTIDYIDNRIIRMAVQGQHREKGKQGRHVVFPTTGYERPPSEGDVEFAFLASKNTVSCRRKQLARYTSLDMSDQDIANKIVKFWRHVKRHGARNKNRSMDSTFIDKFVNETMPERFQSCLSGDSIFPFEARADLSDHYAVMAVVYKDTKDLYIYNGVTTPSETGSEQPRSEVPHAWQPFLARMYRKREHDKQYIADQQRANAASNAEWREYLEGLARPKEPARQNKRIRSGPVLDNPDML